MHKSFEGVSVTGIVKEGEIYLFCNLEDRGWQPEPLDFLYTIKKDNEILPALDMEMNILSEIYTLIKYIGYKKISEDCYQFKMRCFDELGDSTFFSLYLQRIFSFEEKLKMEIENECF